MFNHLSFAREEYLISKEAKSRSFIERSDRAHQDLSKQGCSDVPTEKLIALIGRREEGISQELG
ncbi:hypothetical protein OAQ84_00320 [Bdellovibrionales bacterium]|nr:hypothetical protein [Bdellovibrionales bacterium]